MIYRSGYSYKKVGIVLGGIVSAQCYQRDLFHAKAYNKDKRLRAMAAFDAVNQQFGPNAIAFAAEGVEQRWRRKCSNVSPQFTTCWEELLTIHI